ncbi:lipocalin family protein (plasmid) [Devosia sp. A8/3-2]|nr:lipocalin family protein [Devosia sp. A8/3-2]
MQQFLVAGALALGTLAENGKVRVDNRCFDEKDKAARTIGEASPVDDTNARLKVTFVPRAVRWIPFTSGDYWVLKIDPEYEVALVGSPNQKYLWVLARRPSIQKKRSTRIWPRRVVRGSI